jgi:hypothetical protein
MVATLALGNHYSDNFFTAVLISDRWLRYLIHIVTYLRRERIGRLGDP